MASAVENPGRKAVFLDRDGVINRAYVRDGKPYPPATVDEWEILPGVVDACRRLRDHGFWVAVVTNQPDIARGTLTTAELSRLHRKMQQQVEIDAVFVCPHDDADGCSCRKPHPGMLNQAAAESDLWLAGSYLVGDRWRDIEAGRRAGCRTVHIDHGYLEQRPEGADVAVDGLGAAADWILDHERALVGPDKESVAR